MYIPDITERFPEGFGGVDLTDSFFPSKRDWRDLYYQEMMDDLDDSDFRHDEDDEVIDNGIDYDALGKDELPFEV